MPLPELLLLLLLLVAALSTAVSAAASLDGEGEPVEEALVRCRHDVTECRSAEEACWAEKRPRRRSRECAVVLGQPEKPREWPPGYGDLLKFPFGLADMKALKDYARELWQPDGTAATLPPGVTDRGFEQRRGTRCVSEMVGVHPLGGPGERWTKKLWEEAQDWCLSQHNCTGIMLFVGRTTMNCHYWCARPQYCSGVIDTADGSGVEPSLEWNLFVRRLLPG